MQEQYVIIIPQFNDWEALNLLIDKINADLEPGVLKNSTLLIVDDCSSRDQPAPLTRFLGKNIRVIRLVRNLGHQRAITVGISYASEEMKPDWVVVMDADGEDAPADINKLILGAKANPSKIIFARRNERSEGRTFKLFYIIYKAIFKFLTGETISFGNFSLIPSRRLKNLSHVSDIWNNYPGGVIKSRLPYSSVPINRAKRLAGKSKMNFFSLMLHGLSAISVMIDVIAVRVVILLVVMSGLSLMAILLVLYLKLIHQASPGWASSLASSMFTLLLQSLLISLFLVFMVLNNRSQQHFIPALSYSSFIDTVETID